MTDVHDWIFETWDQKPRDKVYKVPLNIIALHGILPATLTASEQ